MSFILAAVFPLKSTEDFLPEIDVQCKKGLLGKIKLNSILEVFPVEIKIILGFVLIVKTL